LSNTFQYFHNSNFKRKVDIYRFFVAADRVYTAITFTALKKMHEETNIIKKDSTNLANGIKLRKSHITEMWCGIFLQ